MSNSTDAADRLQWVEMQRIATLAEAARLSGLSIDTLKRRYGDKILNLSVRRRGMRVADALQLNTKSA